MPFVQTQYNKTHIKQQFMLRPFYKRHCTTNRKVAGPIPGGVSEIF
jgi:hypothetical protein